MADINFVDQVTVVPAAWLQDVDNIVYRMLGTSTGPGGNAPASRSEIVANLGAAPAAGNAAQTFAVANATASNQAVNWEQAGTQVLTPATSITITPVAFNTLVVSLLSAVGTITVNPGAFFGQHVRVYGCAYPVTVKTNVTSGSPFLAFPDGSTSYTWVIETIFHQYIDLVWDGLNWRCTTAGQTVVAAATANNQAVNLGQFSANTAAYGWRKVPNANSPTGYFIEQWGRSGDGMTPQTSGSSTAVVWNFPIAFPNACLSILANDMGNGCHIVGINAASTTQAQAWGMAGTTYATTSFAWFAVGY